MQHTTPVSPLASIAPDLLAHVSGGCGSKSRSRKVQASYEETSYQPPQQAAAPVDNFAPVVMTAVSVNGVPQGQA